MMGGEMDEDVDLELDRLALSLVSCSGLSVSASTTNTQARTQAQAQTFILLEGSACIIPSDNWEKTETEGRKRKRPLSISSDKDNKRQQQLDDLLASDPVKALVELIIYLSQVDYEVYCSLGLVAENLKSLVSVLVNLFEVENLEVALSKDQAIILGQVAALCSVHSTVHASDMYGSQDITVKYFCVGGKTSESEYPKSNDEVDSNDKTKPKSSSIRAIAGTQAENEEKVAERGSKSINRKRKQAHQQNKKGNSCTIVWKDNMNTISKALEICKDTLDVSLAALRFTMNSLERYKSDAKPLDFFLNLLKILLGISYTNTNLNTQPSISMNGNRSANCKIGVDVEENECEKFEDSQKAKSNVLVNIDFKSLKDILPAPLILKMRSSIYNFSHVLNLKQGQLVLVSNKNKCDDFDVEVQASGSFSHVEQRISRDDSIGTIGHAVLANMNSTTSIPVISYEKLSGDDVTVSDHIILVHGHGQDGKKGQDDTDYADEFTYRYSAEDGDRNENEGNRMVDLYSNDPVVDELELRGETINIDICNDGNVASHYAFSPLILDMELMGAIKENDTILSDSHLAIRNEFALHWLNKLLLLIKWLLHEDTFPQNTAKQYRSLMHIPSVYCRFEPFSLNNNNEWHKNFARVDVPVHTHAAPRRYDKSKNESTDADAGTAWLLRFVQEALGVAATVKRACRGYNFDTIHGNGNSEKNAQVDGIGMLITKAVDTRQNELFQSLEKTKCSIEKFSFPKIDAINENPLIFDAPLPFMSLRSVRDYYCLFGLDVSNQLVVGLLTRWSTKTNSKWVYLPTMLSSLSLLAGIIKLKDGHAEFLSSLISEQMMNLLIQALTMTCTTTEEDPKCCAWARECRKNALVIICLMKRNYLFMETKLLRRNHILYMFASENILEPRKCLRLLALNGLLGNDNEWMLVRAIVSKTGGRVGQSISLNLSYHSTRLLQCILMGRQKRTTVSEDPLAVTIWLGIYNSLESGLSLSSATDGEVLLPKYEMVLLVYIFQNFEHRTCVNMLQNFIKILVGRCKRLDHTFTGVSLLFTRCVMLVEVLLRFWKDTALLPTDIVQMIYQSPFCEDRYIQRPGLIAEIIGVNGSTTNGGISALCRDSLFDLLEAEPGRRVSSALAQENVDMLETLRVAIGQVVTWCHESWRIRMSSQEKDNTATEIQLFSPIYLQHACMRLINILPVSDLSHSVSGPGLESNIGELFSVLHFCVRNIDANHKTKLNVNDEHNSNGTTKLDEIADVILWCLEKVVAIELNNENYCLILTCVQASTWMLCHCLNNYPVRSEWGHKNLLRVLQALKKSLITCTNIFESQLRDFLNMNIFEEAIVKIYTYFKCDDVADIHSALCSCSGTGMSTDGIKISCRWEQLLQGLNLNKSVLYSLDDDRNRLNVPLWKSDQVEYNFLPFFHAIFLEKVFLKLSYSGSSEYFPQGTFGGRAALNAIFKTLLVMEDYLVVDESAAEDSLSTAEDLAMHRKLKIELLKIVTKHYYGFLPSTLLGDVVHVLRTNSMDAMGAFDARFENTIAELCAINELVKLFTASSPDAGQEKEKERLVCLVAKCLHRYSDLISDSDLDILNTCKSYFGSGESDSSTSPVISIQNLFKLAFHKSFRVSNSRNRIGSVMKTLCEYTDTKVTHRHFIEEIYRLAPEYITSESISYLLPLVCNELPVNIGAEENTQDQCNEYFVVFLFQIVTTFGKAVDLGARAFIMDALISQPAEILAKLPGTRLHNWLSLYHYLSRCFNNIVDTKAIVGLVLDVIALVLSFYETSTTNIVSSQSREMFVHHCAVVEVCIDFISDLLKFKNTVQYPTFISKHTTLLHRLNNCRYEADAILIDGSSQSLEDEDMFQRENSLEAVTYSYNAFVDVTKSRCQLNEGEAMDSDDEGFNFSPSLTRVERDKSKVCVDAVEDEEGSNSNLEEYTYDFRLAGEPDEAIIDSRENDMSECADTSGGQSQGEEIKERSENSVSNVGKDSEGVPTLKSINSNYRNTRRRSSSSENSYDMDDNLSCQNDASTSRIRRTELKTSYIRNNYFQSSPNERKRVDITSKEKFVPKLMSRTSNSSTHKPHQRQRSTNSDALSFGSGGATSSSPLNEQLCTFTATGRSFKGQHWYHCLTCGLSNEKGCCAVCARVCHAGHVVTYARKSRFFCDCGAGDTSAAKCDAKKTRVGIKSPYKNAIARGNRASSSTSTGNNQYQGKKKDRVNIRESGDDIILDKGVVELLKSSDSVDILKRAFEWLLSCENGNIFIQEQNSMFADSTLKKTKVSSRSKKCTVSRDDTLVSEVAAASIGGICLSSSVPQARRDSSSSVYDPGDELIETKIGHDHGCFNRRLLVCNSQGYVLLCERNHVKVFHMGSLLCDAALSPTGLPWNARNRKVTLASMIILGKRHIGFEPVSLIFNPENDSFLAVVGKTDCAVLTLGKSGQILTSMTVDVSLKMEFEANISFPGDVSVASNSQSTVELCIKSCFWVPGSQTCIVIVTPYWIKIFDLSVDKLSPIKYYSVPEFGESIIECTFVSSANESTKGSIDNWVISFTLIGVMCRRGVFRQEVKLTPNLDDGERKDDHNLILCDFIELIDLDDPAMSPISVYPMQNIDTGLKNLIVTFSNGAMMVYSMDKSFRNVVSGGSSTLLDNTIAPGCTMWEKWCGIDNNQLQLGSGWGKDHNDNGRTEVVVGVSPLEAETLVVLRINEINDKRSISYQRIRDGIAPLTENNHFSRERAAVMQDIVTCWPTKAQEAPDDSAFDANGANALHIKSKKSEKDQIQYSRIVGMCMWPPSWAMESLQYESFSGPGESRVGAFSPFNTGNDNVNGIYSMSMEPCLLILFENGSIHRYVWTSLHKTICSQRQAVRDAVTAAHKGQARITHHNLKQDGVVVNIKEGGNGKIETPKAESCDIGTESDFDSKDHNRVDYSSSTDVTASWIATALSQNQNPMPYQQESDASIAQTVHSPRQRKEELKENSVPLPFIFEELLPADDENSLRFNCSLGGEALKISSASRLQEFLKTPGEKIRTSHGTFLPLSFSVHFVKPGFSLMAIRVKVKEGDKNDFSNWRENPNQLISGSILVGPLRREVDFGPYTEHTENKKASDGAVNRRNMSRTSSNTSNGGNTNKSMARWYDLPLTPLESLLVASEGGVSISFLPHQHGNTEVSGSGPSMELDIDSGSRDSHNISLRLIDQVQAYVLPVKSKSWNSFVRPAVSFMSKVNKNNQSTSTDLKLNCNRTQMLSTCTKAMELLAMYFNGLKKIYMSEYSSEPSKVNVLNQNLADSLKTILEKHVLSHKLYMTNSELEILPEKLHVAREAQHLLSALYISRNEYVQLVDSIALNLVSQLFDKTSDPAHLPMVQLHSLAMVFSSRLMKRVFDLENRNEAGHHFPRTHLMKWWDRNTDVGDKLFKEFLRRLEMSSMGRESLFSRSRSLAHPCWKPIREIVSSLVRFSFINVYNYGYKMKNSGKSDLTFMVDGNTSSENRTALLRLLQPILSIMCDSRTIIRNFGYMSFKNCLLSTASDPADNIPSSEEKQSQNTNGDSVAEISSASPKPTKSIEYRCDGCQKYPLRMERYNCTICPDFDLCRDCYVSDTMIHDQSHKFCRVPITEQLLGTRGKIKSVSTSDSNSNRLKVPRSIANDNSSIVRGINMKAFGVPLFKALLFALLDTITKGKNIESVASILKLIDTLSTNFHDNGKDSRALAAVDMNPFRANNDILERKSLVSLRVLLCEQLLNVLEENSLRNLIGTEIPGSRMKEMMNNDIPAPQKGQLALVLLKALRLLISRVPKGMRKFMFSVSPKENEAGNELLFKLVKKIFFFIESLTDLPKEYFLYSSMSMYVNGGKVEGGTTPKADSINNGLLLKPVVLKSNSDVNSIASFFWRPFFKPSHVYASQGQTVSLFSRWKLPQSLLHSLISLSNQLACSLTPSDFVDLDISKKGLLVVLETEHLRFGRRKAKEVLHAMSTSLPEYKWLRNEWLFRSEFEKLSTAYVKYETEKEKSSSRVYENLVLVLHSLERLVRFARPFQKDWKRFVLLNMQQVFELIMSKLLIKNHTNTVCIQVNCLYLFLYVLPSVTKITEEVDSDVLVEESNELLNVIFKNDHEILNVLVNRMLLCSTDEIVRTTTAAVLRRVWTMCCCVSDTNRVLVLLRILVSAILRLPAPGCFPSEIILLCTSFLDSGDLDIYYKRNLKLISSILFVLVDRIEKVLSLAQEITSKHPDTLLNRQLVTLANIRLEQAYSNTKSSESNQLIHGDRHPMKHTGDKITKKRKRTHSSSTDTLPSYSIIENPQREYVLPFTSGLSSDGPCPTCQPPKLRFRTLLLERIKSETRWTATTMIVQLDACYLIEGIHVEMNVLAGSLSSSNFVKSGTGSKISAISIYYNNIPASDIVSLRGNWKVWQRAVRIELTPAHLNQKRTKTLQRLPVPVTACNLLFEYETTQEFALSSACERLCCPRCENTVSDSHGICQNCGEMAFQCRLCRNINYENLHAFLCVECGYCRYARFIYGLQACEARSWPDIKTEDDKDVALARLGTLSSKLSSLNLLLASARVNRRYTALSLWNKFSCRTSIAANNSRLPSKGVLKKRGSTSLLDSSDKISTKLFSSLVEFPGEQCETTKNNEKKTSGSSRNGVGSSVSTSSISALARSSLSSVPKSTASLLNLDELDHLETYLEGNTGGNDELDNDNNNSDYKGKGKNNVNKIADSNITQRDVRRLTWSNPVSREGKASTSVIESVGVGGTEMGGRHSLAGYLSSLATKSKSGLPTSNTSSENDMGEYRSNAERFRLTVLRNREKQNRSPFRDRESKINSSPGMKSIQEYSSRHFSNLASNTERKIDESAFRGNSSRFMNEERNNDNENRSQKRHKSKHYRQSSSSGRRGGGGGNVMVDHKAELHSFVDTQSLEKIYKRNQANSYSKVCRLAEEMSSIRGKLIKYNHECVQEMYTKGVTDSVPEQVVLLDQSNPIPEVCSCCSEMLVLLLHELIRATCRFPEMCEQFSSRSIVKILCQGGISIVNNDDPSHVDGKSSQKLSHAIHSVNFSSRLDSSGIALLSIVRQDSTAVNQVVDYIVKQTQTVLTSPWTLYKSNWLAGPLRLLVELSSLLLKGPETNPYSFTTGTSTKPETPIKSVLLCALTIMRRVSEDEKIFATPEIINALLLPSITVVKMICRYSIYTTVNQGEGDGCKTSICESIRRDLLDAWSARINSFSWETKVEQEMIHLKRRCFRAWATKKRKENETNRPIQPLDWFSSCLIHPTSREVRTQARSLLLLLLTVSSSKSGDGGIRSGKIETKKKGSKLKTRSKRAKKAEKKETAFDKILEKFTCVVKKHKISLSWLKRKDTSIIIVDELGLDSQMSGLDVLDGLSKLLFHVIHSRSIERFTGSMKVALHVYKLLYFFLHRHGIVGFYYLTIRGFFDRVCELIDAETDRICDIEAGISFNGNKKSSHLLFPELEGIWCLCRLLDSACKLDSIGHYIAGKHQHMLLRCYSNLFSLQLFRGVRLESIIFTVHGLIQTSRLLPIRTPKTLRDKDTPSASTRNKEASDSSSDAFLLASCKLIELYANDLDRNGRPQDDNAILFRRLNVLLDEVCDAIHPEKERAIINVLLQRSPTQEEYFRGNLPKNPLNTLEIPRTNSNTASTSAQAPGTGGTSMHLAPTEEADSALTSVSKNANESNGAEGEPTMRDLRAKIGADLDLEHATEVMELLVAGKIINLDLTIRVVYEKLWKPRVLGEAEELGSHSEMEGDESGPNVGGVGNQDDPDISHVEEDAVEENEEDDNASGSENDNEQKSQAVDTNESDNDSEDENVDDYETFVSEYKSAVGGVIHHRHNRLCADYTDGGEFMEENEFDENEDEEILSDTNESQDGVNPMLVTYRLQGIDGEATEDYVDTLVDEEAEFAKNRDPEELFLSTRIFSARHGNGIESGSGTQTETSGLESLLQIVALLCSEFNINSHMIRRVLSAALSLLNYCSKIRLNRMEILRLNGMPILLKALLCALRHEKATMAAEQLLFILEALLSEANANSDTPNIENNTKPVEDASDIENQFRFFLNQLEHYEDVSLLKSNPKLVRSMARILPFLTYGMDTCVSLLLHRVVKVCTPSKMDTYDKEGHKDKKIVFQYNCILWALEGIGHDISSMRIRESFWRAGLVKDLVDRLARFESSQDEKGEMATLASIAQQPSCPIMYRVLSALVRGHTESQAFLMDSGILQTAFAIEKMPASEVNNVGQLADQLLRAVCLGNEKVTKKLKAMKDENRKEKRKLALARREKMLKKMGLDGKTKEKKKGKKKKRQKVIDGTKNAGLKPQEASWMEEMDKLEDEHGLVCTVCQEGYNYKPKESIGVYVYFKPIPLPKETNLIMQDGSLPSPLKESIDRIISSRCKSESSAHIIIGRSKETKLDAQPSPSGGNGKRKRSLSSFEKRSSSYWGCTTVTCFNCIHFSCHDRAAQADAKHTKAPKEEWEGAELRNAQTRCNNLLPLRGPASISIESYKSVVDRFIQIQLSDLSGLASPDALSCSTPSTFSIVLHDIKTLLLRFAYNESLSEDTRGGGKEANFKLLLPMLSLGDYLLNEYGEGDVMKAQAAKAGRSSLALIVSAFVQMYTKGDTEERNSSIQPEFLFCIVATLFIYSHEDWEKNKAVFLTATYEYAKKIQSDPTTLAGSGALKKVQVKDKDRCLKAALIIWALVNEIKSISAKNSQLKFWRQEDPALHMLEGVYKFYNEIQQLSVGDLKNKYKTNE